MAIRVPLLGHGMHLEARQVALEVEGEGGFGDMVIRIGKGMGLETEVEWVYGDVAQ